MFHYMYKTEMTEQLIYRIYKITNSIDDKIYIGSTHLNIKKKNGRSPKRCSLG
jgi:hypothetical protein